MRKFLPSLFLLFLSAFVTGQTIYSGRVTDVATHEGIPSAAVSIKGILTQVLTDENGEFRISREMDSLPESRVYISGHILYWDLVASASAQIVSIAGQVVFSFPLHAGPGQQSLAGLNKGLYILKLTFVNGRQEARKFVFTGSSSGSTLITGARVKSAHALEAGADSIMISKEGYYPQVYQANTNYTEYELMPETWDHAPDYLTQLIRPEAFAMMEGPPLNPVFGAIKSVKLVYSISDEGIYYANSTRFFIHYDFARDVLGYNKGHYTFNQEQYTQNAQRKYILASLNYFSASGIYTLDFWAGDELTCMQIEKVYHKVAATTYVGDSLKFYSNNMEWISCNTIPSITSEELFAGQNFQSLNPAEAYGYLKKFTLTDLATQYAGRHDIALLNGIPNDIAIVAGIITTDFQTPLSHINVLSHNRGAPNMALKDGWTNPQLSALLNKLVYLKVTLDTFEIREATVAEAQNYWSLHEPSHETRLNCDTVTSGLINLENSSIGSTRLIGGKAANFAELMKVQVQGMPLPLPEDAFAIPFYYYWQHMHRHKLDILIRNMLNDPHFLADFQYRKSMLENFQDSIKSHPVDQSLLDLIQARLGLSPEFSNFRFRSSTNSEDIKGFNGAGLYDSYTGITGDPVKSYEKAILKVWASLWNLAAFEERQYFRINQMSVAMAILVHRSFPDESANGVLITKNLYNDYNPAFTVNAQAGEISITNPEGNYLPDEMICYTFDDVVEYISHSNAPGMENKTVLSQNEIKKLVLYCTAIQNYFCNVYQGCFPLDIEFKVDLVNGVRKLYIKQARLY